MLEIRRDYYSRDNSWIVSNRCLTITKPGHTVNWSCVWQILSKSDATPWAYSRRGFSFLYQTSNIGYL